MFSPAILVSRTSSKPTSLKVVGTLPTGAITEVSGGVVAPSEEELVSLARRRTRPGSVHFVFNGFLLILSAFGTDWTLFVCFIV